MWLGIQHGICSNRHNALIGIHIFGISFHFASLSVDVMLVRFSSFDAKMRNARQTMNKCPIRKISLVFAWSIRYPFIDLFTRWFLRKIIIRIFSSHVESSSRYSVGDRRDKCIERRKNSPENAELGNPSEIINWKYIIVCVLLNWCEPNHIDLADTYKHDLMNPGGGNDEGLFLDLYFLFRPLMQFYWTTIVLCIIRLNDANLLSTKTDS